MPYYTSRKTRLVDVATATDDMEPYLDLGFAAFQIHFDLTIGMASLASWSGLCGADALWLAPRIPPTERFFSANRHGVFATLFSLMLFPAVNTVVLAMWLIGSALSIGQLFTNTNGGCWPVGSIPKIFNPRSTRPVRGVWMSIAVSKPVQVSNVTTN
ncbi:MAG: hypothetical protein LR015_15505 [Verrucomicrobia bacterium]|nr:hypothetical protein [Verrucomicrobiota bacterium]